MRHIFDPRPSDRFPRILRLLETVVRTRSGLRALEALVRYFDASGRVDDDELREALTTVFPEKGAKLMGSMVEKWTQEGKRQGSTATTRELVIEVLEARFGGVPASIVERIGRTDDIGTLKALHREGVTVESLEQFQDALERVSES
jgi:hypothetical protein